MGFANSDVGRELAQRLEDPATRPQEISDRLDALDDAERVAVVRSFGRSAQRRLYELVDGFRPLRLEHLVPPSAPDFTQVRHYGRNTLPAFKLFEKRFCRPHGADAVKPGELYGFNFQAMAPVTGPGYFVAREDATRPEVLVDYTASWSTLCAVCPSTSRLVRLRARARTWEVGSFSVARPSSDHRFELAILPCA
ncbi:MAG: hypothetical protein JRG80_17870 [Deltaproteobacteria bacterium]|nr:hypothetical protein [Deltaproteobacteria bacterium]